MNLPKKILIINWQDLKNPQAGGAEVHLHEVAKRMIQNGTRCILYVSGFEGAPASEVIDGIEVHRQGSRWNFNFVVYLMIRKWCQKHDPDLVIDDSNKVPFLLPWLISRPVLIRIHHLFRETIFREASFFSALYVYIMESLGILCWRNRQLLTVSESTRSELELLGVNNVMVALNGVNSSEYFTLPSDKKYTHSLLYLGRIKKYKGIDTLIDSVLELKKKFTGIKLIIAGRGDDLPRLQDKVEKAFAADTVTFRGFVKEQDKRELYSQASLMLNHSLKEGYGLTTIEANACGTCVIASDVPGLKDSIKNGETGFLVPYGDTQNFCRHIEKFFSDSTLREKMQKAAIEWAAQHTWDNTCSETIKAIEKL